METLAVRWKDAAEKYIPALSSIETNGYYPAFRYLTVGWDFFYDLNPDVTSLSSAFRSDEWVFFYKSPHSPVWILLLLPPESFELGGIDQSWNVSMSYLRNCELQWVAPEKLLEGYEPAPCHHNCDSGYEFTTRQNVRAGNNFQHRWLCEHCRTTRYIFCASCHYPTLRTRSYEAPGDLAEADVRYCQPCLTTVFIPCGECDTATHRSDMIFDHAERSFCQYCWDDGGWSCSRCGSYFHYNYDSPANDEDYDYDRYCEECVRSRLPRYNQSSVSYEGLSQDLPNIRPFGVEIETEWDEDTEVPPHGGYHGFHPASPPFFEGWRAEHDGSLINGVEFISPIMMGLNGFSEVLATFQMLDSMGAQVGKSTVGQHIHLSRRHSSIEIEPWKVQAIGSVVEDFLLATTGSWKRSLNEYTPKLKGHDFHDRVNRVSQYLHSDAGIEYIVGSRGVVCLTDQTVEFRYPQGTLNPSQFAINLGLCQLIMQKSLELDDATLRGMVVGSTMWCEPWRTAYRNGARFDDAETGRIMHQAILYGAQLVAEWGWHQEGTWSGMPYLPEPDTRIVATVNGKYTFRLPTERQLIRRLVRQISSYYRRAAIDFGGRWWSSEEAETNAKEVLDIFQASVLETV